MTHKNCPICLSQFNNIKKYECIDNVDYYECDDCESIFAEESDIFNVAIEAFSYNEDYWKNETAAAKDRSFGSSINRCAEVFLYSRIPIKKFLDIGTGPGYLLDALSVLMPNYKSMFYGVELFPPPHRFRTSHENYIVGDLTTLNHKFSGGCCIEVIEHLTPTQLRKLASQLANVSEDGAVFYFNSAQPDFVKNEDPGYLDPLGRGHIVSYSILGLRQIFSEYGFAIIPLPGRAWGFLAEFKNPLKIPNADGLLDVYGLHILKMSKNLNIMVLARLCMLLV